MKQKYWFYALFPVFFWSLGSVVIRLTFGSITTISFAAFRSFFGAIVLMAICAVKKVPPPKIRDLPLILLAGILGFTLYTICFNTGLKFVTAATANVVMATVPLFTAILALALFKERVSLLGWLFTLVSFSGVLILMLWNGVLSVNEGVFWFLAAAILNSAYNVIHRKMTMRYTALQCSAYSLLAGAVSTSPFLPGAFRELGSATPEAIAVVVYTGILSGGVGYFFWSQALALTDRTASVTNLLYLPPFIASIIAYFMFRELPGWGTVIGGAVILIGLWLFQKYATTEKRTASG